jgi:integrase/recombinase XerC/integrase/recombinase XerD
MHITLKKAIELFLLEQEVRGNSKKTIEFYCNTLRYFTDFFGEERNVSEITMTDINNYVLMLLKRDKFVNHPYKPTINNPIEKVSIQTYSRSLKVFLNWCYENEYTDKDLTKKFKLIKPEKKVIIPLYDDEIEQILSNYNEKSELGLRNKSIILLMLDCGLRLNEVVNLNLDDIFFDKNMVRVNGKGDKQRLVPMGKRTKECLMKYVTLYRPVPKLEGTKCKSVFISKDKGPITADVIKMFMQRLRDKTGITRLKPHLLRHTFATLYVVDGGDLESLRIYLGHTDIKTTQRYLHLANTYMMTSNRQISHIDRVFLKRLKT